MKTRIALVLCLLLSLRLQAQNYSLYNGYFLNPFAYNPAAAATEQLVLNASYRRQWVEIQGAPSVGTLTGTTLLDERRAGVGFKISTVSKGILNSTDVSLAYAYGIPLNRTSRLFFGLAGGVLSNSINSKGVTAADDPALASLSTTLIPSVSFGMLYKNSNGLNFGFNIPKMVSSQNLDSQYSFSYADNLIVSASFSRWDPSPKFVKGKSTKSYGRPKKATSSIPIELYGLYRYSSLFGSMIEATARYNFNKSVWLSGSYRQYQGVIPGIGFNLDNVSLSYFYELGVGGDIPLRTHEVLLTMKLGKAKKFRDIPPPPTQIAKVPQKQPTVTAKVPQKNPVVTNQQKTNEQKNNTTPQQPVVVKKEQPVVTKTNPVIETKKETPPVVKVKKDSASHKPRYEQKLPQLDIGTPDENVAEREELNKHLDEHGDGKHDDTHNEPINERHDFVKRGTHTDELPLGTYVIAGAFSSRENADHYVSRLKAMGYTSADFGHLSARNLWYVFIAQENQIPEAKKERDRLQKNKIFAKVWLLTVQE